MEWEISTREGVLQLLRTACKLKLMRAAAGGDLLQSTKTLLDCRTSGTNRRTDHMQQDSQT